MKKDIRTYMWAEFVVWFLIVCTAILGFRVYKHFSAKQFKSYQIFLPDADGMIEGSPVKYMGIQIGYIHKIYIVDDEVYVKFIVSDKNLELPKSVIATVEFSGMGGSKSLEIYPPTTQSTASGKLVFIQNPTRLNDALGLLADMYEKIGSITTRISYFGSQTGAAEAFMKSSAGNFEGIQNNLKHIETWVDERRKNGQPKSKNKH